MAAYGDGLRSTREIAAGRSLPLPELGDGAVAITFRQATVRYFRFAWRERNVTGYVSVSGFDRRITLGTAERLA